MCSPASPPAPATAASGPTPLFHTPRRWVHAAEQVALQHGRPFHRPALTVWYTELIDAEQMARTLPGVQPLMQALNVKGARHVREW